MKSPLDDAKLRLSAVHPEMSALEMDRAATKIADGMTEAQITEHCLDIHRRMIRIEREQQILELQMGLLHRAFFFQQQRKIS